MSRKLFSLTTCLVLILSFGIIPGLAQAEGVGSISGMVTEQGTGVPIVGMEVAACDYENGEPCFSGWTDTNGVYLIQGVPAGIYIVDSGWSGNWVVEIYSEKTDYGNADLVEVVADEETQNVDFTLELGGSISGTVTEQDTGIPGTPIIDMEVAACDYEYGEPCFSGWTDTDGNYFIRGVPAGTYIVDSGWSGDWAVEIYSEQTDYGNADPVEVVADMETQAIDFTLNPGGSISGTVTEQNTGNPIEGMEVAACPFYYEEGMPCYSGWTEEDGSYYIRGVPFGTYRLDSGWSGNWVVEYYKNTPFWEEAKPVKIKPVNGIKTKDKHFNVTGIDFTLEMGGSISGTVTEQDTGVPIEGMEVAACDYVVGVPCFSGWTEADGSYFIPGISVGTYSVDSGWDSIWVFEIFPYPVAVMTDTNTPNIDFALELDE